MKEFWNLAVQDI